MVKEDRSHRDHKLNPRKYPRGKDYPDNLKNSFSDQVSHIALLEKYERNFIQDVPRILGGGNYANLGHSLGASAILLVNGLKENGLKGKVYSIDLFSSNKQIRRAIANIEQYSVADRLELCFGSTKEWADKLRDQRFVFVFVDADHSYVGVKEDIESWTPLVHVGGWICLHDTNQAFSHKAISDTLERMNNWEERKDYHIDRIRTFERLF